MNAEPLVLVVDDEPAIVKVLRLELVAEGFRVVTATTATEAIEAAAEERPDLALLDVLMSEMSGYDLMKVLHDRWHVPVVS